MSVTSAELMGFQVNESLKGGRTRRMKEKRVKVAILGSVTCAHKVGHGLVTRARLSVFFHFSQKKKKKKKKF